LIVWLLTSIEALGAKNLDEILRNFEIAKACLKKRGEVALTEQEFRDQCKSYVVGNAFDVFSDSEVINRALLEEVAQLRLRVAS
jgi:hypothetical protein